MGALTDSWSVAFVFGLLPGTIVAFILAIVAGIMDAYWLFQVAIAAIFVVAAIWAFVGTSLASAKAKPKKRNVKAE